MGGILATVESDVEKMEADKELSANQQKVVVQPAISNDPPVDIEQESIARPTVNDAIASPGIMRPSVAIRTNTFSDEILRLRNAPAVQGGQISPSVRLSHTTTLTIVVVVDAAVILQMSLDDGTSFYDLNGGNALVANAWTTIDNITVPKGANLAFATSAQCNIKEMYVFA